MLVTPHAENRIRARISAGSPLRTWTDVADSIVAALEAASVDGHVAIEVHRWAMPIVDGTGSNGDQLVVIAREGTVETVMLRRSWNQRFTPAAMGVDRCLTIVV